MHSEPEPVKASEPEPVKASEPEPVKASEPEQAVKASEPEPVKASEPEPVKASEPEPVKASEPEPVKAGEPEPVKAGKKKKGGNYQQQRSATRAPIAIGSLAAALTAKIARRKPQAKMLEIIGKNWREILAPELVANFAEQTRPLKIVYVRTLKSQRIAPTFKKTATFSQKTPSQKTPLQKIFSQKKFSQKVFSQKKATLTLAVTKGFAPIAIHQLDQVITALNTFLGEELIETIVLKQKNTLE